MEYNRCKLILEPISKRINVAKHTTIYDAILALDLPLSALCGGKGACGKCLIRILKSSGNISEPTEKEFKTLGEEKISEGYRLACQAKVLGPLRVYLTKTLIPKHSKILVGSNLKYLGININKDLNPIIRSRVYTFSPSERNTNNPTNYLSRLVNLISEQEDSSEVVNPDIESSVNDRIFNILKKLPLVMKEKNNALTIHFRRCVNLKTGKRKDWEIFDVDPGKRDSGSFGMAFDIGTTTIVGYLINLNTGGLTAISASLNPQVAIGEDLISRVTYIISNNAVEKAKRLVIDAMNEIIEECCQKAKISVWDIKDITVVGNTGMLHMFLGLPPDSLSVFPYIPVYKSPLNIKAGLLNINCNPHVNIYSPPVIAGYVGTDTIGCIVSTRIDTYEKYTLLIDIGTNGELVMGNKDGLATCSCAAGSALEGAHISCGMRGSEGAIDSVLIDKDSLEPTITTIGNTAPIGICGSGLIDTITELLKSRIINRAGKFNITSDKVKKHRRIIKKGEQIHYVLYNRELDKNHSGNVNSRQNSNIISISEGDIHQVQLAKGAFLAATNLMLEKEEKKPHEIEQVLLAGGFGTYIDKENAAFLGLFPEVDKDNIHQIGNAAGIGAQRFIESYKMRDLANEIAHKIKYYEIASSPKFQKDFTFSLYFPHYDLDRFPSLKEKYEVLS